METKQDVILRICELLKIPAFAVSTGSTEPREFLLAVADQLGVLSLTTGLDKPGIGKLIVESSGQPWLPDYDSRGSTITKDGLLAIESVVQRIVQGS